MDVEPTRDHAVDPLFQTDAERRHRAEQALWTMLGTLWRRRLLIIGVTGLAAVLSIVLSLMMDNWFKAETRLLLPTRSGSGLLSGAILGSLPASASSLLGGISGDYQRYLSILDSRTVKESVVQRFNLIERYDVGDAESPMQAAVELLEGNMEFVIDDEYNYLSVQAYDRDPQRAADMANFLVDELTRINSELASQSAGAFRGYVEQRYDETVAALDSVLNAQRDLQARYGVLDLQTQGAAFFTGVAELRVNLIQAEVEYEQLLNTLGPSNPMVQRARETVRAANRQYNAAFEGQDRMLPISQDSLPEVARQFIKLQQEQLVLARVMEYSRPVLEEARLEEQRKIEAVQVIDAATAPVKKARPSRTLIVVSATLSGFLLAVLYALLLAGWKRHHADFARRLKAAAASTDPAPPEPPPAAPSL